MCWKGNEYSFTTGQFAKLDQAYRRHCGPTAITNLVYALAAADGRTITEKPENVFRRIAGIGGRRLIYFNADFLKIFGGTSDLLVPIMIRRCLKEYGIKGYRVSGPFPATSGRICRELDRGSRQSSYAVLRIQRERRQTYAADSGRMDRQDPRSAGRRGAFRLLHGDPQKTLIKSSM